ncbi:hypothetical protein BDY24DRAFT_381123 [Mrakia frigida]|uniref:uncharacterized protein n=1 Tax=Mrakia frigida TaxID=29902 RepID=UPI003FCC106A
MAPSISSPVFLASFAVPSSSKSAAASSKGKHVKVASVQPLKGKGKKVAGSNVEEVAVGVDGEGIWRYDVATTNPTSSHTVPPTTTFSTPPLSLSTRAGTRVTIIGVQTSEGISKSSAGKSIWCWRGEDVEKEVLEVPTPVSQLLSLSTSPNHLLLLSPSSAPSLVSFGSSPLTHIPNTSSTSSSSKSASSPVYAAVFSRKSCAFAAGSDGDVLVEVYPQGSIKIWSISSSYEEDNSPEITLEREITSVPGLKKKEKEEISQAGLSEKGTLQILTNHSHLHTLSLSSTTLLSILAPYTFPYPSPSTSIASLPTAYTFLLQPTTSLLHLVSPLFPAVLASIPLPASTLSSNSIHVVPLLDGRLALIAGTHSTDGSAGTKVGVWTMELQGGASAGAGGIGEVLFTGERTAKVLIPVGEAPSIENQHTQPSRKSTLEHPEQQPPFSTLLPRIRQALAPSHSSTATADATKALLEKIWAEELTHEETRLASVRNPQKAKSYPVVPYATAKTLIELFLEAPKEIYPGKLVTLLLQKGYFSDHMVGGAGLFEKFVERQEWENVFVSMRSSGAAGAGGNLPEVSEKSVVKVLKEVLLATEKKVEGQEEVGAPTPTLQKTVVEVVRFGVRSEEAGWKEAVGSIGVEGAVRILEVVDGWMEAWLDGTANKIPEVDEFVPLLTLILDTHLLPLLTHPSAPPLLASINARLAPHLKVQKELESAKSCLDAAMRMGRAAAASAKASSGPGGAKSGKTGKGGKKGGKAEKEDMGAYRLEEFAL